MKKYIPNILTISRFILIPFIIIALIKDSYILAIILLTVSALTDILDGQIARRFNLITDFGKLVDPLADKATQISILISLAVKQIIPIWVIAIIFVKEVLMVIGATFLYKKKTVVSSRWYGKLSTVLIYLAVVSSCIITNYNNFATSNNQSLLPHFDIILYIISIISTLFSLFMYWKDDFKEKKGTRP